MPPSRHSPKPARNGPATAPYSPRRVVAGGVAPCFRPCRREPMDGHSRQPRREGKAEYLLGEMRHRGKSQTRPNAGEARQPGKSGTAGDRHPASWRPSHDAPRTAPPSFSPPPVRCAAPFTGSRPLPRRSRPAPPLRRRAADRRRPPPRVTSAQVGAKGWPPACRYATMFASTKPNPSFSM